MQTTPSRLRRVASLSVAVLFGGVLAVAVPAAAHATQATVARNNSPSGPPNRVDFTVTNDTAAPLAAWRLDFDLPAGSYPVGLFAPVRVSSSGTRHTVTNGANALPIGPGQTYRFTLVMYNGGFPANCVADLTTPCGDATDVTPPTTPANLVATRIAYPQPAVSLHWTASTDDVWLIGYEVRANGGAWSATFTGTSRIVPATSSAATYEVRAVDAQGNRSAAATVTLPAA